MHKLQSSETDMQAIAVELNNLAKSNTPKFNFLLRERASLIISKIDNATLQDLILILSAVCIRISRHLMLAGLVAKS